MPEAAIERICCEAYGPGGVAMIVTCAQGSPNVPRELLRNVVRARGGRLGAPGSVAYLFRPVGVLRYPPQQGLEPLAEASGVEEVIASAEGQVDLYTDPAERDAVERRLAAGGHRCLGRATAWRAMQQLRPGSPDRQRLLTLVQELKAIDGVGNVYTNAQIADQLLAPV